MIFVPLMVSRTFRRLLCLLTHKVTLLLRRIHPKLTAQIRQPQHPDQHLTQVRTLVSGQPGYTLCLVVTRACTPVKDILCLYWFLFSCLDPNLSPFFIETVTREHRKRLVGPERIQPFFSTFDPICGQTETSSLLKGAF